MKIVVSPMVCPITVELDGKEGPELLYALEKYLPANRDWGPTLGRFMTELRRVYTR
jgi:hypothetical protein